MDLQAYDLRAINIQARRAGESYRDRQGWLAEYVRHVQREGRRLLLRDVLQELDRQVRLRGFRALKRREP